MKKEALFWKPLKDETVQCLLCPHHCVLALGKVGICGVRKNEQGTLYSLIYQACSSMADDPIEKKPLYHFHPGSMVLSLGSVGCTFRCEHCQNYHISMSRPEDVPLRDIPANQLSRIAIEHGCQGIAWTYNEPTIWHEYTLEAARLVKKEDLYTVYVTNGYIEEEPLRQLAPYLDAMNIDVKAFHDEFYHTVCKATLTPVIQTCERAKRLGIHLELTYLVIPGLNDDASEVQRFCHWIAETLGTDTPVHFSRFHPDYQMKNHQATSTSSLLKCHGIARDEGLQFVYLGNIPHGDYDNTYCPSCKNLLIERYGFSAHITGMSHGKCSRCNTIIPIR
ncbi:MAG: AmmeMemoRadiSam system radical SAM enzyme [Candidatus Thermoplasmatota archaeon]|nr:AmmeMemoRadiSam system radical SAM enzyme [Candidatus Thermoplasmatota archaeon]